MTLELWAALEASLLDAEADGTTRALVYASNLKRPVFTAGNDIKELHAPSTTRERHARFWGHQTRFLARLLRSPLLTVAAVRGACPAGGCALALCCDFRVATPDAALGLNEVALGIGVPPYWAETMCALVGRGVAEKLLIGAKMTPAQEALRIGLVDEVVADAEALMPAVEKLCAKMLKFPDAGRVATKHVLRNKLSVAWEAYADEEARKGWEMLSQPSTVASLSAVLARLSGAGKKAKL